MMFKLAPAIAAMLVAASNVTVPNAINIAQSSTAPVDAFDPKLAADVAAAYLQEN